MGTKRPVRTIYDTVPIVSMSDHNKLQPGGKITRDPSPRPALTAQTDRGREGSREDEWRRDRDVDRRRDKEQKYKEPIEPPRDRYYDRDRGPKTRDVERDRQENRNVRPLSNIEKENDKEGDRGLRKGDTFPRNARNHGPIILAEAMEAEKEERRRKKEDRERVRDRERDRDRARDRPKDREDYRGKSKDEARRARDERDLVRYREVEDRRRDGGDQRDRYGTRRANEKHRRPREPPRMTSPERRNDREMYWDRAERREGRRDTRSEGEIDERQRKKERVRHKEEMNYQHSRSEGETRNKTDRERREYRDTESYREREDRHRNRDDRYKDSRDTERPRKRSEDDRRREERQRDRDYDETRRKDRPREKDSQTQPRPTPRVPPRVPPRGVPRRPQSSGEWSSDMDGETKVQTETKKERKMWLDPQRDPTSREDRENRKKMIEGEETREMNVDGDLEWSRRESCPADSEENTGDSEEGSDVGWVPERDRIVSGEDGFVTVSSGDEEEREDDFKDCVEYWEEERDTEDTVDEDELSDEPGRCTPQKFVFCVVGQTSGQSQVDDRTTEALPSVQISKIEHEYDEVREFVEKPTSVDQTAMDGVKIRSNSCHDFGTIKRDSQTEKLLLQWREKTHNDEEPQRLSPIPSNPYADVPVEVANNQIQSTLERRHSGAMTPEEEEAIRIRMSGAWSMTEETKRHSQAPHLKWAKNVVREILGQSDESLENPQKEEGEAEVQNAEIPQIKVEDGNSEEELEEDDDEEEEELKMLRGMATTSQGDMHAGVGAAMHGDAPAHTQTLVDVVDFEEDKANPLVDDREKVSDDDAKLADVDMANDDAELETYLAISNTLYKPNSCPSLNYDSDTPEIDSLNVIVTIPEEKERAEKREDDEKDFTVVVENVQKNEVKDEVDGKREKTGVMLSNSCSFRDLGPEARLRRRGIRKTTERRKEDTVKEEENEEEEEEKEEEGAGRDRRTRIFSISDDEDGGRSKSWGELDLRSVLDSIGKQKRNSKFFKATQLYQQYSENAQNFEILRQARSEVVSICESSSPAPAQRPLPPLPQMPPHPHSLSHHGSVTSVQSLPLPAPPRGERRASSPHLSISIGQGSTLWRDLPAVRNSTELQALTEDKRKLQEVRFEVVTSEASYCRSLDIVVDHFVKSKQLGALLTTQDRNWLFSRLSDVRAISHSFLAKLEEKVDSDIVRFTVCDVIARHCQRFKMVYVPYLTNQSYQDATYQRLMNENQGFRRVVEKLERSTVCQRLPLRSFLVLPFQRITRIKLLVQNIVKRTTPKTEEATQAIKALKLLEKLIQEGNDSITQMKSIESLVSLSARVDFECKTLPLISQSRRLVREGKVTELMDFSLKETERSLYLHLFNDYLLLSQQKEGGRFTVLDTSPVSELRTENCRVKLATLQKNLFRLHMAHKSLLLRTDTQSDKLRWISAMSRPHPEVDFSAAQDFSQMQCIRAFVAQQPDELSLEKADIILVHQTSDHWVEGTRLSDRQRGWVPESHLDTISNSEIRKRNLSDALKLTTATAQV